MRSNDDDDDDIMVRPGHESLILGGERSSRTFFCALHGQFLPHSRSFGCIWPALFSFPVLHQGPGPSMHMFLRMHVTSPSPSPFAFSLGHLAIEGRTHEIFKLVV